MITIYSMSLYLIHFKFLLLIIDIKSLLQYISTGNKTLIDVQLFVFPFIYTYRAYLAKFNT